MARAIRTNNVAPNLVNREFEKRGPRMVLLTDITYIPLNDSYCYLSTIPTAKPNGLYRTREEYVPKRGDLIFFNWDGLSWGTPWNETSDNFQHVGIVEKVEDGRVYTIEGNRGSLPSDQTVVGRYNTTLKNKYIRGYCIPNYSAYGS